MPCVPRVKAGGAARQDARRVGGFDQPDDPPPQHAAARCQGSRSGAELSRDSLSAARAGCSRRLAESVCEVSVLRSCPVRALAPRPADSETTLKLGFALTPLPQRRFTTG